MGENGKSNALEELRGSDLVSSRPGNVEAEMEVKTAMGVRKKFPKKLSLDEEEFMSLLHGSDPVKIEINRLQNEVKEKDRELGEALSEIKSLRLIERAKDKALTEVTVELEKIAEKLQALEAALEDKNLEIKRISDEKKAALSAQFAAEATLRRVHAAQKDEELPSLDAILSPLEAEIRFLRQEVTKQQDDNKALERLTKSKEAALLEIEKEVQFANMKAALVDDLLNKNQELTKQNDICQEEYKILDRMHRHKAAEVEKLGQTIRELEEALLSGAAAANAVRDYKRQVCELKREKKTLERALSRVMVSESRVAAAVANEWKDDNHKVIPVKQWLEERRVLMGEMQQLREKLTVAERAIKAETQIKERCQLRLKVVEDGLKCSLRSGMRCDTQNTPNGLSRSRSVNGADTSVSPLPGGISVRKTSPAVKSMLNSPTSPVLKHAKEASKSFDGGRSTEDHCRTKTCGGSSVSNSLKEGDALSVDNRSSDAENVHANSCLSSPAISVQEDFVSGILYDILQKEVICLRNTCQEKDLCLKDKDNSIESLSKKIDTLTKAMEVETRKLRREKAAIEKEVASMRIEKEQDQKPRRLKGVVASLQT
ncbi:Microtubule-associated protein 70-2 [Apostasia shenzhenica]|uniref:Microtubule-associated protein 70-2 n=1 Tax=Apostasia shenzhenica TaxID=1088818 RepID=A0A2I0AAW2_9ASPA|nr:Microtubule-associated protein 70-2 [Apostasia shenzhenica]